MNLSIACEGGVEIRSRRRKWGLQIASPSVKDNRRTAGPRGATATKKKKVNHSKILRINKWVSTRGKYKHLESYTPLTPKFGPKEASVPRRGHSPLQHKDRFKERIRNVA